MAGLEEVLREGQRLGLLRQPLSQDALRWAFSMLLSRSIRLPSRGDLECLVPWADMANHECAVECYIDWDTSTQTVGFTPDRAYKKGEQACLLYM